MRPEAVALALSLALWKKATLLVFFAAFVGIVTWLLVARPERFDRAARLPLDGDPHGTSGGDRVASDDRGSGHHV